MADTATLARELERLYPRRCVNVEFWPTPEILNAPLTVHGRMRVARTKVTGSGTLTATVTAGRYYVQGVRWDADRNRWCVKVRHFGGRYRTVEEAVTAAERLRSELGVPQRRRGGTGSVFWSEPYTCKSGRRQAGHWVVNVPMGGGKRIRRNAPTKAEAERMLAQLLADRPVTVAAASFTGMGTLLSTAAAVPSYEGRGTLTAEVKAVDLRNVYWSPRFERWDVYVRKCYGGRFRTTEDAVAAAAALRARLGVPDKPRRRPSNAGSICWLTATHRHKGFWRAAITVHDSNGKARRKMRNAATRESAEQLLAELLAETSFRATEP